MNIQETIRLFLPKYLSPDAQQNLLDCIKDFPDNIDSRFYTNYLKDKPVLYQGDGIQQMPISNFPSSETSKQNGIVFSNTCDTDLENQRLFPSRIIYAPIVELSKYKRFLEHNSIAETRIDNHISTIKKQEITQIFYLPSNASFNEATVFMDRLNNCSNEYVNRDKLPKHRIFTLSNYGYYLFLLKMSLSMMRIHEKVDRG